MRFRLFPAGAPTSSNFEFWAVRVIIYRNLADVGTIPTFAALWDDAAGADYRMLSMRYPDTGNLARVLFDKIYTGRWTVTHDSVGAVVNRIYPTVIRRIHLKLRGMPQVHSTNTATATAIGHGSLIMVLLPCIGTNVECYWMGRTRFVDV